MGGLKLALALVAVRNQEVSHRDLEVMAQKLSSRNKRRKELKLRSMSMGGVGEFETLLTCQKASSKNRQVGSTKSMCAFSVGNSSRNCMGVAADRS